MAQSDPIAEQAQAGSTQPARPIIRHDGWTTQKQVAFLQTLATTGSVAQAARSVGMSRQSAYKLRARLEDAPFGASWRMATQGARSLLLEAALDRAINGVEVPHYWQGELVGTSRRFDERLTAALRNSGLLETRARVKSSIEDEYAGGDLTRLLERIVSGPPQWCDFEAERGFAYGDHAYGDNLSDLDQADNAQSSHETLAEERGCEEGEF
ncbi:MAG: hypothetical protein AAF559_03330 [Pseudomonadota bacterium]